MKPRRVALEVVIAALLGLVSVGTTFSAYQATVLTQQAADLASVSQQLRDRNLTEFLSSQLSYADDTRRVTAAFALESDLLIRPESAPQVAAERETLRAAASPALRAAWEAWAQAGYGVDNFPPTDPDYVVAMFAVPQSLQYASFVTDGMVDRVTARAQSLTGAAVIFALALFVLGLAGVLTTPRVILWLAMAGAGLFLVALIVTIVASG